MRHRRIIFLAISVGAAVLPGALLSLPWPMNLLCLLVPALYLVVIAVGVMNPRFALFAPVVCAGPTTRPEVALTFDDGPNPTSTRKVLDVLERHGVHATFFVLGGKTRLCPDVVREAVAAGHEIGIHGETHDRWLSIRRPDAITASLARTMSEVEAATEQRPRLFRPPIGHVSPRTAVAAARLGLTLVAWSVRSRDGRASTTADAATRRVLAGLRPGAIVLLHDAAEHDDREPIAPAALPAILDAIARQNLKCVTVSELLR
jgi:peptidoglycan/xylan/chitin deacetylase (PgdA/CDA1 family)